MSTRCRNAATSSARTGCTPVVAADTAGSAAEIAERGDKTIAAIASELAGQIYGLVSLAREHRGRRAQHDPLSDHVARAATGRRAAAPTVTTFVFNVRNVPAALYKALGGFATNGVNMTKLESYMVGGQFHRDPVLRRCRGAPRRPAAAAGARGARVLLDRGQDPRRLSGPPAADRRAAAGTWRGSDAADRSRRAARHRAPRLRRRRQRRGGGGDHRRPSGRGQSARAMTATASGMIPNYLRNLARRQGHGQRQGPHRQRERVVHRL